MAKRRKGLSEGFRGIDPRIDSGAAGPEVSLAVPQAASGTHGSTADAAARRLDTMLSAAERLRDSMLRQRVAASAAGEDATVDRFDDQIVGWAVGLKTSGNAFTGEWALKALVREKLPRSRLHAFEAIPAQFEGYPTDVEVVGTVSASSSPRRMPRPVPCGCAVGVSGVNTYGTLGAVVIALVDYLGDVRETYCILSNNHVIAAINKPPGTKVLQPGGSQNIPHDIIAELRARVELRISGNLVDAAIASTMPSLVSPQALPSAMTPVGGRTAAGLPILERALPGMSVKKLGARTDTTHGVVDSVLASLQVDYPGMGLIGFRDVFSIRGLGEPFGNKGDSGSLVVNAVTNVPVGLYFADNMSPSQPPPNPYAYANRIEHVVQALSIREFLAPRSGAGPPG